MDPAERERSTQTVCLLLLSFVAAATALYWLRPVMIPFVLALFIALGLAPLIELPVRRWKVPRWLALPAALAIGLVLLVAIGGVISASVAQLAANSDAYEAKIARLVASGAAALPLDELGISAEDSLRRLREVPVGAIGNLLLGTTNAIVDLLSKSLLVVIFLVYLLIGTEAGGERTGMWLEVERRIQRYIATKAAVSAATGVLVGTVLTLLDIDLALVFGLFAFLLNFIPSIGSVIATLLPLPVVLLSPEVSFATGALAIALPGAIQLVIGNVVEPKIMGESLDLHPIAILMALIFWGMLWGITGMLLATPITAVLKILFERLELTRPLGDLLAGRIGPRSPTVAQ